MIQRFILILLACLNISCQENPQKQFDAKGIKYLDLMSQNIGKMESCSFTLYTIDKRSKAKDTLFAKYEVYFKDGNKMHFYRQTSVGRVGFWFSNSTLKVFNFDNANYQEIKTDSLTLPMIDRLHREYQIDFPAADFFYPSFTDDIMSQFDQVFSIQSLKVDLPRGNEINFIEADNKDANVLLGLDAITYLPVSIEIHGSSNAFYMGSFENWRVNPEIPDELFEFIAPENAKSSEILKLRK